MSGTRVCVVCRARQLRLFEYRRYEYFRCPSCRLVSTYPYPSEVEIASHYATRFREGNYQLLRAYEAQYRRVYEDLADVLCARAVRGGKVLDIGCFTGGFMQVLAGRGFDVNGVELQREAVEIANERIPGRVFQTDEFTPASFDAVSMNAVIEHVLDPRRLVRRAFELLKPGGVLLLETPDSGSWFARLMGRFWPPYAPVEHIHLFSRRALNNALTAAGFTGIEMRRHWKRLPVRYVVEMLRNFGPEFYGVAGGVLRVLPGRAGNAVLPFCVGEVVVTAIKPSETANASADIQSPNVSPGG